MLRFNLNFVLICPIYITHYDLLLRFTVITIVLMIISISNVTFELHRCSMFFAIQKSISDISVNTRTVSCQ